MPKIYFATDIHGSDICWKKFLGAAAYYQADALVLGGDMTGKAIVPVVLEHPARAKAVLLGSLYELEGEAAILDFEKQVRSRGYYPARMDSAERDHLANNPDALHARFVSLVCQVMEQWLDMADQRLPAGVPCIVCPGNDDPFEIDQLIAASGRVVDGEGLMVDIGGFSVAFAITRNFSREIAWLDGFGFGVEFWHPFALVEVAV